MKKGGKRQTNLLDELTQIRNRFYGFYLLSCEDIGMRPLFMEGEVVERDEALRAASEWLEGIDSDSDLKQDTRVSVPIYVDKMNNKTLLWSTIGVRLMRLEAEYVVAPRIAPTQGGEWRDVERHMLATSRYVIAVDEFAELTLRGTESLTRDELRTLCNRHRTKKAIIKAALDL